MIWITDHALLRAQQRLRLSGRKRVMDEALTAMLYGKRQDNNFVYDGVAWGFNARLDTLKTVFIVADQKKPGKSCSR